MNRLFSTLTIVGLCAGAALSLANAPRVMDEATSATAGQGWSYDKFVRAFEESKRNLAITPSEYEQIQQNKLRALVSIERYLTARFGKADESVLKAFATVPREYFQYNYAKRAAFAELAYEERAKPWAIGYGSALSDYLGQAYMTQLAQATADDIVLEIGTGSGFQVSLLSRIVKKAYSIEIIEALGQSVAKIFEPLAYNNIETRVGDGFYGWPEVKEGFDIIIVTCAAQYVPPALFKQLKPGGRLVIPIGQPFKKGQILYLYTKDDQGRIHSKKDVGVYFVPMTGEMMKDPRS